MARIGVLTMSDGRDYVNRDIESWARLSEDRLVSALEKAGHTVVKGSDLIWTNQLATSQARLVAQGYPDLTIFNYSVWAFPHFSMLAAAATTSPIVLMSNIDPVQPGMVGMLAAGGGLDQIGRIHGRVWGDVDDRRTMDQLLVHVRAAQAVGGLRGSTFGRFGGRPMGMYTAVSNSDQWINTFGVDVEEIDQWEIVRRADLVDQTRVSAGRKWLEGMANVHYDGDRLTPDLLERQIRAYHAVSELIAEWNLDFSGIKGQPELTTHFATMDVTEAFLNDPYDWEGPKEPHVCATESDMDGALTMQILKLLSGDPVLFADVRHYHTDDDIWDLCNSGQHATWYAGRNDDPAENLSNVHLYPEVFFFPAGGASVSHVAAPGEVTLARLTRNNSMYRMQVVRGAFEEYGEARNEELARMSTFEWPHAFTRMRTSAQTFLSRFGANHIHAVPGDYKDELEQVCRLLDIEFDLLED